MGISLVKMKFIAEFLSYPVVLLVVLNLEVVDALEVLHPAPHQPDLVRKVHLGVGRVLSGAFRSSNAI